ITRVVDYYKVKGVLWPMPFNVSNLVLLYNKQAFTKAGLDPEKPPATFDEIRAASEKIVASGAAKAGIALKRAPEYPEQWLAKAGEPYVNNGNGRQRRARAACSWAVLRCTSSTSRARPSRRRPGGSRSSSTSRRHRPRGRPAPATCPFASRPSTSSRSRSDGPRSRASRWRTTSSWRVQP